MFAELEMLVLFMGHGTVCGLEGSIFFMLPWHMKINRVINHA